MNVYSLCAFRNPGTKRTTLLCLVLQDLLNVATIASGSTVMGGIIAKAFEKVCSRHGRPSPMIRHRMRKADPTDFVDAWCYLFTMWRPNIFFLQPYV